MWIINLLIELLGFVFYFYHISLLYFICHKFETFLYLYMQEGSLMRRRKNLILMKLASIARLTLNEIFRARRTTALSVIYKVLKFI